MMQMQQDKKLVDQYKQTNLALRKQLNNLNNQIDRILVKKATKLGKPKLQVVLKKITDPSTMQHEIEILKKRCEILEKEAEALKQKSSVNYYQKNKELEDLIREKETEMEQTKKEIKIYERKDKIANVQATKNSNRVNQAITKLQEEISRCERIEKQLIKEIKNQQLIEGKTNNYLQELVAKHGEVVSKKEKQKELKEKLGIPENTDQKLHNQIGQEQWKELKREFLLFKESKQTQENVLNQQNQRLRAEAKEWEKKIKDKRKRADAITDNVEKSKGRQSRVYSTINDPNDNRAYRYRDRNSAMQYTKQ